MMTAAQQSAASQTLGELNRLLLRAQSVVAAAAASFPSEVLGLVNPPAGALYGLGSSTSWATLELIRTVRIPALERELQAVDAGAMDFGAWATEAEGIASAIESEAGLVNEWSLGDVLAKAAGDVGGGLRDAAPWGVGALLVLAVLYVVLKARA